MTESNETQTDQEDAGTLILSTPIVKIDWGNAKFDVRNVKGGYVEIKSVTATGICSEVSPSHLDGSRDFRTLWKYSKMYSSLSGRKLRLICPNYIPVSIKMDLTLSAPDIDENVYLVHGDMPLGEFVEFIRRFLGTSEPISAFCKYTVLPTDASMSAIDEENFDARRFLLMDLCGVEGCARRELLRLREEERKKECPCPNGIIRKKRTPSRKREEREREERERGKRKRETEVDSSSLADFGDFIPFQPIRYLDPWNGIGAGFVRTWKPEGPDSYKTHKIMKWYGATEYDVKDIDVFQLRETSPDYIPLCVEKDAESDIPDIGAKKYQVHGDMPYSDLVEFIRVMMAPYGHIKPIYVFLHNTTLPPTDVSVLGITEDTLMHEIDDKYNDEDGYLHFTYTWEEVFPKR